MRKIIVIFISIPIVLFVILEIRFSIDYFNSRRTPDKIIIPDQYQGWVIIELENPTCPALSVVDGYMVYKVNNQGRFCTSSKQNKGWATDWYSYQSQPEVNLMQNPVTNMNRIWHEYHREMMIENQPHRFYYFYVGPRKLEDEEFEKEMEIIDAKIGLGKIIKAPSKNLAYYLLQKHVCQTSN